jgi:acyl-CoA synthetase (AMP-forming)/AMP-acid ligase II
MDLRVLLDMAVAFDADRVAVTSVEGEVLTTGSLASLAQQAADRFLIAGHTHVAFCGRNGSAMPISLFGSAIAGLPFVPLNYRLADSQLAQIVGSHDFLAVATDGESERLRRLGVTNILDPKELSVLSETTGQTVKRPTCSPDDVALLLYTSGTTAAPKAAVLRHRHLASYVIGTVAFGGADRNDAALLSVPSYHIAGVMNLLTNLYNGRRIVYLDSFEPRSWLDIVKGEAVTHAMVVPTMLARIVETLGTAEADVPSLRTLSYGGAKMPESVIKKALELFPTVAFTNAYGLTETSSTITVLGSEDHREALMSTDPRVRARLHSAGRPLPGVRIEIRDEDGVSCETGETGDIYVNGDQVAGEYLDAAVLVEDWFATRDRGFIDEAGYLFVEGRADDTIIRGGENIAPAEIEDVLLRHEGVMDCAVVGIDDDEWGHRIAAAVVLSSGPGPTTEELRSFARDLLRGSKTPDVIVIVDSLPYTDTGKLLRRTVRESLSSPEPTVQPT